MILTPCKYGSECLGLYSMSCQDDHSDHDICPNYYLGECKCQPTLSNPCKNGIHYPKIGKFFLIDQGILLKQVLDEPIKNPLKESTQNMVHQAQHVFV